MHIDYFICFVCVAGRDAKVAIVAKIAEPHALDAVDFLAFIVLVSNREQTTPRYHSELHVAFFASRNLPVDLIFANVAAIDFWVKLLMQLLESDLVDTEVLESEESQVVLELVEEDSNTVVLRFVPKIVQFSS